MIKKLLVPIFLLLLLYFVTSIEQLKIIIAGIAIFLVGMSFMEDGFKQFSGGLLEKIVEKFTNTILKALSTGFFLTAIVQSSSLVSVIVISFLSAELITLTQAIGVVFGSNIGTTTTAWIISSFGLKIKIAQYAMPMLILGIILKFSKYNTYKGLGFILLGLGFIFLGIGYMKEGFDTLKDAFDLSLYSMEGYMGIFVYILIGIVITVVIQSSSATVAVIITALVSGQIIYINALALAIGSNLGTTITALIGSISSNANGKRLAIAHLIFNLTTALTAALFIYQLSSIVDILSKYFHISNDDYGMKLALFHTIFNLSGVIIMLPFIGKLNNFLQKIFKPKEKKIKLKYLDLETIEVPMSAITAIKKEIINLYYEIEIGIFKVLKQNKFNIEKYYDDEIKPLYGEIIKYSTLTQQNINNDSEFITKISDYKLATRVLVEVIKQMEELSANFNQFIKHKNYDIRNEYIFIKEKLEINIAELHELFNIKDDVEILTKIEIIKSNLNELDAIRSGRIDKLIKDSKVNTRIITSIINDYNYAKHIVKKMLRVIIVLMIEDKEILLLGDNHENI